MKVEVYLDGEYVGADLEEAMRRAVNDIVRGLTDREGQNRLAIVLAKVVQQEFRQRDMVFTGRLTRDVSVQGTSVFFYAPHAWKWARGYHRKARKRDGRFYAAGSDPVLLTDWVSRKAPHLMSRDEFRIRIPETKGFVRDAYLEAVDLNFEKIVDTWITWRVKEVLTRAVKR